MNTLLVFSAVCIGLASAGAHHTYHSSGYGISSGGYSSGTSQQRQLVDVPYTVEYRSSSSGSSARSYGISNTVSRTYQQRPQVQIQRAQIVHQSTSSQPQRRQQQQLVDVPYTVETVQRSNQPSSSGTRYQTYSVARSPVLVQVQAAPAVHTVSVPQSVRVVPVPVSLGNQLVLGNGGYSGLSGSIQTVHNSEISPSYINLLY